MEKIILAFTISLIAGLSTCLGSLLTWFKPKNINNFISGALAFSGTMMILISITELIPEGFFYLNKRYSTFLAFLCLILMLLFGIGINIYLNRRINKRVGESVNLYKVGVLSMIALMIHNLPEGILTFLSTTVDLKLGLKLALTISLHNIPEGIAIAVPIYYSTNSHKRGVVASLISGLSEPLGALLAYLFLYKYITNTMISIILLFVAGIMISISINDIFEESKKYSRKGILIGVILAIVLTIISEFIF